MLKQVGPTTVFVSDKFRTFFTPTPKPLRPAQANASTLDIYRLFKRTEEKRNVR